MEPLSALDASFLYIEDDVQPMHIAVLAIFEGPPPGPGQIEEMVSARLDRVPRYRQKLRTVPFGLGRPVWSDDHHFDLANHISTTAIPHPGSQDQLETLMGRLMEQRLDPKRPLWELWIVEGLDEGRWALIAKVHHCMVDGVAGSDLLGALLEDGPEGAGPHAPVAWRPEPKPSAWSLLQRSAADLLRQPREGLQLARTVLGHPGRSLVALADFADGLASLGGLGDDPVETALNGPIGLHRRWRATSVRLSDLQKIRAAHGGTLNDVVLAAVAAGFRALLVGRGESVAGRYVRSLVPVSIRGREGHGETDALHNRIAAMFVDLPMEPEDPAGRLRAVREAMEDLKAHHQADASIAIGAVTEWTPSFLLGLAARWLRHAEQHAVQTVTTNVPGPRRPLWAAGRRMLSAHPYVPIFGSVRIGVAVFSYGGQLGFGLTGDYERVRDLDVLVDGIDDAFAELLVLS